MTNEVPNRPCAAGERVGRQLSALFEKSRSVVMKKFPNHPQPCESCAFRLGTVPNRCLATVSDALKAIAEKDMFLCHQVFDAAGNPTEPCAGYMICQAALLDKPAVKLPYRYSHEGDDE